MPACPFGALLVLPARPLPALLLCRASRHSTCRDADGANSHLLSHLSIPRDYFQSATGPLHSLAG